MKFEVIRNKLPLEAKLIREEVFIKEQGFKEEFDTIDNNCIQILLLDDVNNNTVGTCRLFQTEENIKNEEFTLGRFAIRKDYRDKHLGKLMLKKAEEVVKEDGAKRIILGAQVRAKDFYKKCGYKEVGEIFLDEGYPHIHMIKELS